MIRRSQALEAPARRRTAATAARSERARQGLGCHRDAHATDPAARLRTVHNPATPARRGMCWVRCIETVAHARLPTTLCMLTGPACLQSSGTDAEPPTCRRLAAALVSAPKTMRSASEKQSQGRFQAARPIMTPAARAPGAGSAASTCSACSVVSTCSGSEHTQDVREGDIWQWDNHHMNVKGPFFHSYDHLAEHSNYIEHLSAAVGRLQARQQADAWGNIDVSLVAANSSACEDCHGARLAIDAELEVREVAAQRKRPAPAQRRHCPVPHCIQVEQRLAAVHDEVPHRRPLRDNAHKVAQLLVAVHLVHACRRGVSSSSISMRSGQTAGLSSPANIWPAAELCGAGLPIGSHLHMATPT